MDRERVIKLVEELLPLLESPPTTEQGREAAWLKWEALFDEIIAPRG